MRRKGDLFDEYLKQFHAELRSILVNILDTLVIKLKSWKADGNGIGLPGEELVEFVHHHQLAADKIKSFYGRDAEIEEAMKRIETPSHYVPKENTRNQNGVVDANFSDGYPGGMDVSLAVIGKSGAGKTAFLAE